MILSWISLSKMDTIVFQRFLFSSYCWLSWSMGSSQTALISSVFVRWMASQSWSLRYLLEHNSIVPLSEFCGSGRRLGIVQCPLFGLPYWLFINFFWTNIRDDAFTNGFGSNLLSRNQIQEFTQCRHQLLNRSNRIFITPLHTLLKLNANILDIYEIKTFKIE